MFRFQLNKRTVNTTIFSNLSSSLTPARLILLHCATEWVTPPLHRKKIYTLLFENSVDQNQPDSNVAK